ncbi:hypothetical protein [Mucilaginibacter sp.]|jgi:hypothetical protein|uniref:hypothetical protein n=1 Tax=Mucilaginibacter sp. TaxID=1882438 RepID=UPI0026036703|nr:hypothetical protein [Mucilaginibacter sp.]
MKLFRKRNEVTAKHIDNPLVIRIADTIHRHQTRVSGYLNRKTQYWNRASKLTALFLFCLLFGSCCLLLLIKAIIH